MPVIDIDSLVAGVCEGSRRDLARAVTLVESDLDEHRRQAEELLTRLLPHVGRSRRIGISGTPGVGKSTLIERIGMHVIDQGHRVAVLAIDPSSQRSGGSILGDKTRMGELSTNASAFVRPSPSRGVLGGVADATRDALLVCEAAGYDVVIVETVGVGQSETAVADICDLFLLLVAPGGGDDLQGIKRGVMELADVLAVNKSDGELLATANHTAADYRSALHLMRPKWEGLTTEVVQCSALKRTGIDDLWNRLDDHWCTLQADGRLAALRADQAVAALWRSVNRQLLQRVHAAPHTIEQLESQVRRSELSASAAARRLVVDALDPSS